MALQKKNKSIGLMSGTSMDGIDAALIETDGKTMITAMGHYSLTYDKNMQLYLKAAERAVRRYAGNITLAKKHYPDILTEYVTEELKITHSLPVMDFSEVENQSTQLHYAAVNALLQQMQLKPTEIDVIGYHGQTLFHSPALKISIQMGDGRWLAQKTGIPVVNHFREADILAGGQGAPFAPLYHYALALRDHQFPLVVINCGGIANITVMSEPHEHGLQGFDTGPGNGLVDRFVQQRTHGQYAMDKDGHFGRKGKMHQDVLERLYEKSIKTDRENYFCRKPPKSLDIGELQLIPELDALSIEEGCATLEAFTADTIVNSIPPHITKCILAGGGWHNPVIRAELDKRLRKKCGENLFVAIADEIGWNSQAMEAELFAYLAVRRILGLPTSFPGMTGVREPLSGGVIHYS